MTLSIEAHVKLPKQKMPFAMNVEIYAEKAFSCFKERLIEKKQKVFELKL